MVLTNPVQKSRFVDYTVAWRLAGAQQSIFFNFLPFWLLKVNLLKRHSSFYCYGWSPPHWATTSNRPHGWIQFWLSGRDDRHRWSKFPKSSGNQILLSVKLMLQGAFLSIYRKSTATVNIAIECCARQEGLSLKYQPLSFNIKLYREQGVQAAGAVC